MVIAVDFDGTLFQNEYPNICEPNWKVINWCKQKQAEGNKLILWTCRHDKDLEDAIEACKQVGIIFDKINSNLEEKIAKYSNDSRKIGADIYIDDKALHPNDIV